MNFLIGGGRGGPSPFATCKKNSNFASAKMAKVFRHRGENCGYLDFRNFCDRGKNGELCHFQKSMV
jgi:hypothetical protein